MANSQLRAALIGCGQIADAHLQELSLVEEAQVVAVCDVHRDLARQAALRFDIDGIFDDVAAMLESVRPDVVHITTPVQTHAQLARQALQAGCHLYVEKPFALNYLETEQILGVARSANRQVCLGHDQLFDPLWLEVRQIVVENRLGTVRHVESVLGYSLGGPFGTQIAANPDHWVRRLPGGLFQNTISHPLYRITDFLRDEQPGIVAQWRSAPGRDFPTELEVWLRGSEVTGLLSFSTRITAQRVTRVYGEKAWLEIDLDAQTLSMHRAAKMPGALGKLESAWRASGQARHRKWHNLKRFFQGDLGYFGGMRRLFQACYRAILRNEPGPITEREIRQHAWIMDEIIRQCASPTSGPPA